MNLRSEQLLTKTPQGVNATRSGTGLPPKALTMLKLLDGTMPVAAFKAACLSAAISEKDFVSTLQDLVTRDHLRVAADGAALAASSPLSAAERRLMQTLDFTVGDDEPAAPPAKPAAAAVPAVRQAAAAPANALQEDTSAQLAREAEIRRALAAELRPRVEEELRATLYQQLDQELRPKLIAALRPGVEAEVRATLTRELTPRVELEVKARFAKTLAVQKMALQPSPPLVPAAAAPAPADRERERVLGSVSTPVFSADKDGVCRYASPAWESFAGYAEGDLLGRPLAAHFAKADRRSVETLLTSVANGSALRFELQATLQRKDGTPMWVELAASPMTAQDGALPGACGWVRDAAELRHALAQAEADSVRLLLLIDQIDTAVILEDAAGNIQQANAALCALLSLEAAPYSLEGMAVSELLEGAAGRFIGPQGFLRRIAELRAARQDVKGTAFIMADGRVIEQDYLAVTVGDETMGHLWLMRERARAPARGAP